MDDHRNDDVWNLCAFVVQCLDRRIELARERRDDLARDFALGSRRVVEAMAQDLADGVPPSGEVRRFLARTAYPFRRHPDFRSEWTRHAHGAADPGSTLGRRIKPSDKCRPKVPRGCLD